MTAPTESSTWYDGNAAALAPSYEAIEPEQLHSWFVNLLPPAPALVLDVGAGTGRDAAWLARLGHGVVAVEPSSAMRAEGERRHPEPGINWRDHQDLWGAGGGAGPGAVRWSGAATVKAQARR